MSTKPAIAAPPPERPQFVAIVTSRHSQVITPDFEGRVVHLKIHSGQRVTAGEIVAELDDSDLKEKVNELAMSEASANAEAGASYVSSGASLHQADIQGQLVGFGAAAPEAVRAERDKAREAGARGAASAARAKQFRVQREDYLAKIAGAKLPAPMDGVVSVVKVKEGELARKGTPIARVFDARDLMVRFAVPQNHRKEVQKGMRVEVLVPGLERQLYATVETVSDELEPPINYTMVDADIDDSKLAPDEVRVASTGYVRLADAGGKR